MRKDIHSMVNHNNKGPLKPLSKDQLSFKYSIDQIKLSPIKTELTCKMELTCIMEQTCKMELTFKIIVNLLK